MILVSKKRELDRGTELRMEHGDRFKSVQQVLKGNGPKGVSQKFKNLNEKECPFCSRFKEERKNMLRLENIKKDYVTGDSKVEALKGITLQFRKSEFVSILGQSGCGKTTLLNIIGGLDRYTSGDLVINGKSTKEFKDRKSDRSHVVL